MITLLKNCLLSDSRKVNILIVDKKIHTISEQPIESLNLNMQIDAIFDIRNNLVMPGIIDSFSKVNLNSAYSKPNYAIESQAAAAGGVTTFIDYEQKTIGGTYLDYLSKKVLDANENSIINFGFFVSASDLIKSKELFKTQEFIVGTILNLTNNNIRDYISNHAQLLEFIDVSKLVLLHLSGSNIDDFFRVCKDKKVKILFYDIVNRNDLDKILKYRQEGYNIRTSISVNFLFLNIDLITNEYKRKTLSLDYRLGTMIDNIALWNAICEKKIDMITSNHTPITLIEKFEKETPGLPGFETTFSMLFDSFFCKKIPITLLERMLSTNPAQIMGIKDKGKIEVGYDADLMIINTTKRWWIKNEDIVSSARWTQFNDSRTIGRVMMTFVNGNLVYNWINQMAPFRTKQKGKMIQHHINVFYSETNEFNQSHQNC